MTLQRQPGFADSSIASGADRAALEAAVCPVGAVPGRGQADAEFIRRRATTATAYALVAAVVAAVPFALAGDHLTLMPAAFILGWLNLVGL